jgi:hypothetical protein
MMSSTLIAEARAAVKLWVSAARSEPWRSRRRSASRLAQIVVVSMTNPVISAGRPSGPATIRPRASIERSVPSVSLTRYSTW